MNILIADDHFIVRVGLKYALSVNPDYKVIGEAENGEEALEKIEILKPDLVIVDITMPILNGLEMARTVKKNYPYIIIMILSQSSELKKIHDALEIGVNAYLLKDSASDDLLLAIEEVIEGRVFLSPEIPEYSVILNNFMKENNYKRPWLISESTQNIPQDSWADIQKMQEYMNRMHTIRNAAVAIDSQILEKLDALLQKEKIFTNEKLTLSKAAQLLAIEPHFLSEIISKNLKITFPQLLNLYRVRESMRLLGTDVGMKSIEVAFRSGFNTKSQYNLVFKEITSITPIEYRQILKEKKI